MIITRDNERLYPATWEYNASRILTHLAVIVENNGGRVKPLKKAIISNRSIDTAIRELKSRLERVEAANTNSPTEKRKEYITTRKAELEKLEAINNEPITVTHTSYISFVLDNTYYYYQVSDNPFFDFYYQKTPIKNNKYSRDAVLMEDPKKWLFDCVFSFDLSQADVIELAHLIFNMLCNAKNSVIRRDSVKKRVPNTYDGGYHYETVFEPERFGNIDF